MRHPPTRISVVLLAISTMAVIGACSSNKSPPAQSGSRTVNPVPELLGQWNTPTGGTIEFKSGGKVTMGGPSGSRELSFFQPDRATIEIRNSEGRTTLSWRIVSLERQELVIIDADGAQVRLQRRQ